MAIIDHLNVDGTLYEIGGGLKANEIVDLIYPVGSIYMSVNTVSPASLFGGT